MQIAEQFSCLLTVLLLSAPLVARADTILNGGFETGNLTGWTVAGSSHNAQVLRAADLPGSGLTPVEGNFFALLSTGPGADSVSGSTTLTTIPYRVNSPNASVSFFLDFLTSQPYADTPNNDYFQFNILGNPFVTGFSGDVLTDINNKTLSLIVPGSYVAAPDGTALTDHTGFGAYFFNLTAYQGQTVQFQFLVSAVPPANFADTALLIDAVSGQGLTPVPEPVYPGVLFGVLLFVLAIRRALRPQI
jgi:hypothetical protein